jgi:predicted nucleotidyltransferase
MAKTALELSPEEWKTYRPDTIAAQRSEDERKAIRQRRQKAIRLARRAAKLLREEFGAKRVMLFGSLAHRGWFTRWSDIDLAAWGIPPKKFYAAVAAMTAMSEAFRIDLVDPEACSPSLREAILSEGIPL